MPVGKNAVKLIPVASFTPWLFTRIEYVTISPSLGVVLSTDICVTSSELATVNEASKSSPLVIKSVWSAVALEVTFTIDEPEVPALTVALIFKLIVAPLAKLPIVQTPVTLL